MQYNPFKKYKPSSKSDKLLSYYYSTKIMKTKNILIIIEIENITKKNMKIKQIYKKSTWKYQKYKNYPHENKK